MARSLAVFQPGKASLALTVDRADVAAAADVALGKTWGKLAAVPGGFALQGASCNVSRCGGKVRAARVTRMPQLLPFSSALLAWLTASR
jgi:hypothetical protein